MNPATRKGYTTLKAKVNTYKKPEDIEALRMVEKKFGAHTDMLLSIKKWKLTPEDIRKPEGELKKMKERYVKKIYTMYLNEKPEDDIINYIEIRLADLFHKVLQEN